MNNNEEGIDDGLEQRRHGSINDPMQMSAKPIVQLEGTTTVCAMQCNAVMLQNRPSWHRTCPLMTAQAILCSSMLRPACIRPRSANSNCSSESTMFVHVTHTHIFSRIREVSVSTANKECTFADICPPASTPAHVAAKTLHELLCKCDMYANIVHICMQCSRVHANW